QRPPQAAPLPSYSQSPYGQPPSGGAPYGYTTGPVDTLGRPLAEWWQRLVAIIIDSVILGIVTGIISAVIIAAGHYVGNGNGLFSTRLDARHVIAGLITFVIDLAYFALLNGSDKGQTVGMMALGITVRDNETGGRIDPQRAGLRIFVLYPGILLRWIPVLGAISGVYTIVVGLSPLWDKKREGWHDKVVKTTVIKVR
ncbi:MAG: RDD family protein, partial [Acidimicrobiales bacterium]